MATNAPSIVDFRCTRTHPLATHTIYLSTISPSLLWMDPTLNAIFSSVCLCMAYYDDSWSVVCVPGHSFIYLSLHLWCVCVLSRPVTGWISRRRSSTPLHLLFMKPQPTPHTIKIPKCKGRAKSWTTAHHRPFCSHWKLIRLDRCACVNSFVPIKRD